MLRAADVDQQPRHRLPSIRRLVSRQRTFKVVVFRQRARARVVRTTQAVQQTRIVLIFLDRHGRGRTRLALAPRSLRRPAVQEGRARHHADKHPAAPPLLPSVPCWHRHASPVSGSGIFGTSTDSEESAAGAIGYRKDSHPGQCCCALRPQVDSQSGSHRTSHPAPQRAQGSRAAPVTGPGVRAANRAAGRRTAGSRRCPIACV